MAIIMPTSSRSSTSSKKSVRLLRVICGPICACLCVSFLLTACTGMPTQPETSRPVSTPNSVVPGQVTGNTWAVSGLQPTPRAVESRVTATATGNSSQNYSTQTTHGSFSLDLAPGTYELTATQTDPDTGGHATPKTVTVTAGEPTAVDLYFIAP